MNIKSAKARHSPNNLWQHSESHDNLQIRIESPQLSNEFLILQTLRLQHRQALLHSIFLNRTGLQAILVPTHSLVRHGDYANDIVTALHKSLQSLHRKIGSTQVNDTQIFLFHINIANRPVF